MQLNPPEENGASLFFRGLSRKLVNRYKALCAGLGKTMKQDLIEIIRERTRGKSVQESAPPLQEVSKKKKKKKKKRDLVPE